jgi:nucleoside-diphosphate-sugar epimerase
VRDVARACQAAIEADLDRHEVFNLSAPDTFAPLPTLELIEKIWPTLTDLRDDLDGFRSLIDCRKAARLLGHEAVYSVRDEE